MSKYATLNSDYFGSAKQNSLIKQRSTTLQIAIIREMKVDVSGRTKYVVEVHGAGRAFGMECVQLAKFSGIHNFEEFNLRPWLKSPAAAVAAGVKGAGDYSFRSGDVVLVAELGGTSREGVIIGGISHPGREPKIQEEGIAYMSCFQGLETSITEDGCYKVTYNGAPINSALLEAPPTGASLPEPSYNPTTAGSYFLFDDKGSYTIADDNGQIIKMKKQTGNIVIVSGDRRIELGDADSSGLNQEGLNLFSDYIYMTADVEMNIYVDLNYNLTADTISIGATQIAIGNSDWELFDQIEQFIDILAEVTLIDSQGGPTLPFMMSPEWSKIEEWKSKMCSGIKGEITEVEPLSASII